MPARHSLLRRQLKRHFPEGLAFIGPWASFIDAVDSAYGAFDDDREMLERSLELSSQELLQTNSEMRAIYQAIPDLLFHIDQSGRILSVKAGMADDLTADARTMVGCRIQDFPILGVGEQFARALEQLQRERKMVSIEYSLVRQERRAFYEARLVPVLAREAMVIIRNITERKHAEEELRHTVSLQQSTFESTADGILVVDLQARLVSCNRRYAALWQIPVTLIAPGREEQRRLHIAAQLKAPEEFLRRVSELYLAPESESSDTIELKDGRVFERYSCPQLLEGVPIGRVWSYRDVTERQQAESALRAEEERFRLVAIATRDAIYDWNLQTGQIWRNEGFLAIYGGEKLFNADSVWWEEQVHPEDRHRVKQSLADALIERNQLWAQEYRFRREDGRYATLMDRGCIIYDADGRPVRMIGAMTDISERKQLEEQFLQAQKMDAIGQLAGGVAHDFNNLLTVIQGHLSLLRLGGMNQASTQLSLDESFRAAQRAANLTRQLLTFSRREPVALRALELNETVAEMTRMFHRLVGEHITIQTLFAPGGLPVLADPGMIEQLLMNLVVNARDAMPRGGRLELQTGDATFTEAAERDHPACQPGRFVHLLVRDTGTGIAPEHRAHIFEPFFTTKEAGKGTGLGLATVFGIVQQHKGWIEVESQLGEGTTFHVYLPRLDAPVPVVQGAPEAPALVGGTESILLAEDEEMVRQWMHELLKRFGYRVHATSNGVEALEYCRKNRPTLDLLVTDMIMPGGLNGLELGAKLQAEMPGLKVLYCSGYTDAIIGADVLGRDHVSFLPKPFDADKFLQSVRRRLDAS